MYDHTINRLPEQNEKFHYFKTGLASNSTANDPQLVTLPQLIEQNGHTDECNMILKIDIEGAEWDVLRDLDKSVLSQFDQIVLEFHNLTSPSNKEKMEEAVQTINQTHSIIHIHPNNCGTYKMIGNKVLPELIEATYVLKSRYGTVPTELFLPHELDQANNVNFPDIYIGSWGENGDRNVI
jgi:hypothetical protein